MRTTVTLDPDVAAALKEAARRRDISFKQALNDAVRAGLLQAAPAQAPYRVPTREMGVRAGIDLTRALHLADEVDDQATVGDLDRRS